MFFFIRKIFNVNLSNTNFKVVLFLYVLGIWQNTFARFGEDWFFLAFLGVISSLLSFSMDYAISMCQKCKWFINF